MAARCTPYIHCESTVVESHGSCKQTNCVPFHFFKKKLCSVSKKQTNCVLCKKQFILKGNVKLLAFQTARRKMKQLQCVLCRSGEVTDGPDDRPGTADSSRQAASAGAQRRGQARVPLPAHAHDDHDEAWPLGRRARGTSSLLFNLSTVSNCNPRTATAATILLQSSSILDRALCDAVALESRKSSSHVPCVCIV